MKKCLIIGKTHVGKTLFFIHFSNYLGVKRLSIKRIFPNGVIERKLYTLEDAIEALCSNMPFKTQCLQSIELDLPLLKGNMKLEFVDSCGLTDGIHGDVDVRRGMVQTLCMLRESDIILHLIDINSYGLRYVTSINTFGKTDLQLTQHGISHQGYAILANRIDLLDNRSKLAQLQQDYPQHTIIPVSALTGQGFNEVKAYCYFKSRYL
ncbi:hypothetical protein HNQ80_002805 [Anaerosolibacter carboniphilus]|uniref:G domain-containing protein n=1 Tax=Anaerosolibacter carboniphilus TaxID=1417629 RepID=A0A841KTG4_9FIRM|nr:GTPase [Anaerosolibacter carboniphilus]MBB6216701.1 hypothetical protein [Anaerosolibacter carboniphilus]